MGTTGAAAHVRLGHVRIRRGHRGDARLVGHASSRTTETVYRYELRPIITTGADVMDKIFTAAQREG